MFSPRRLHPRTAIVIILSTVAAQFICVAECDAGGNQTYIPDRYKGVILFAPEPDMPAIRRSNNRQAGSGLYRLIIDAKSGGVNEVKVMRRIGVRQADAAAIWALFKWKFRPGVLQCIDVPVVYAGDFGAILLDAVSVPVGKQPAAKQ